MGRRTSDSPVIRAAWPRRDDSNGTLPTTTTTTTVRVDMTFVRPHPLCGCEWQTFEKIRAFANAYLQCGKRIARRARVPLSNGVVRNYRTGNLLSDDWTECEHSGRVANTCFCCLLVDAADETDILTIVTTASGSWWIFETLKLLWFYICLRVHRHL